MILRQVRLSISPEHAEAFCTFFEEYKHTLAVQQGCVSVKLYTDSEKRNTFITLTEWHSVSDLERYRQSELFQSTWSKVKPWFESPAVAHTFVPFE